jgi:hypothetical protein
MQQIQKSFLEIGKRMTERQISFAVIGHEMLAKAQVRNTDLMIAAQRFRALVLPVGVDLPEQATQKLKRFEDAGGWIFRARPSLSDANFGKLAGIYKNGVLSIKSDRLIVGRFIRDERNILLVVNVAAKPYTGAVKVAEKAEWIIAEPAGGQIENAQINENGWIALSLPAHGSMLLIGPSKTLKTSTR